MRLIVLVVNAAVGLAAGTIFAMMTFAPNDPQPVLLLALSLASALVILNEFGMRSDVRRRILQDRRLKKPSSPRRSRSTKPFSERLRSFSQLNAAPESRSDNDGSSMPYWCVVDLTSTTVTRPKSTRFIRSVLHRIRAILNRKSPPSRDL